MPRRQDRRRRENLSEYIRWGRGIAGVDVLVLTENLVGQWAQRRSGHPVQAHQHSPGRGRSSDFGRTLTRARVYV
ncbi:MAG TPA: hypothetical protein VFU40_03935, partial [Gemmatimonadales bacterium]|nr:hypothetical protein [Gemmatimonadales bacterium]